MLPGQRFWNVNGQQISTWLAGSNMPPDYNTNTVRNTPQIQAKIKAGGLTLMRCAIPANSADSYIDLTANACTACGCDMLLILIHDNPAWNQHVVSYLGNRCNLYEFANEPDLYPASGSQYYTWWSQNIPTLRTINPNAAFIGPVLGVFANLNSFVTPWLTSCKNAGGAMLPDAISYHIYPCTGTQPQATCAPKANNFSNCFSQVDAFVKGILGYTLPQCLTEWNIDANAPPQAYTQDPAFCGTWTTTALNNMAQAGFAMACQFDAGSGAAGGEDDLVSTQSPYNAQVQYQPMANVINTWISGNSGGGGGGNNSRLVGPDSPIGFTIGSNTNSAMNVAVPTDLNNLGTTWLRWQPFWQAIEKSKGVFTWGALDSVVSACNSAKVNLMLTISHPPTWWLIQAQTTDNTGTYPVPSPQGTQAFATAIAQRYDGNHGFGVIQGLELGNEDYDINTSRSFQPLADTMNLCYKPLKNAYPTLIVGPGASFPRNTTHIQYFWRGMWNAAGGNFDYVNSHYYTCTPTISNFDPSDDSVPNVPSFAHNLSILQGVNSAAGHPNFPIWITETGFAVNTNPGRLYPKCVTDLATQSNYLKYELDTFKNSGQAGKLFIYMLSYTNNPPTNGVGNSDGMSLVQTGISNPIPAYTMVKSYPKNWGGGSTVKSSVRDLGMRVRLQTGSGTTVQDLTMRAGVKTSNTVSTLNLAMRANISGISLSDTFQRTKQPQWGTASDGNIWTQAGGTATTSIVYNNGDGLTIGLNPGAGHAATPFAYWSLLFADMAKLGMSWLRFQLSWANIELTQGNYTWQALDDAVSHCNAAGIKILYTIRGAPAWALLNPSQLTNSEPWYIMDPTLTAGFATALMQRYYPGSPNGYLSAVGWNEDFNIHNTTVNDTLTLNQTLNSGTPYTSFAINASTITPLAGTKLYMHSFASTDIFVVSGNVSVGDTTVNVNSFTPGSTYTATETIKVAYIGYHASPYPLYNAINGNTSSTKTQPARDSYFASPVYKSVYTAIRALNATIPIGLPCMWTTQPVNGGVPNTNVSNYTAFMQQMYNDGIKNYMDANTWIDFHYYSNGVDPNTGSGQVSTIAQAMADLRAVAAANNDAGRFIWLTEYGWEITNDVPDDATQAANYSKVLTATAGSDTKRFFFTLSYVTTGSPQSSLVQYSGGVYSYRTAFTTTLIAGLPTVGQVTGAVGVVTMRLGSQTLADAEASVRFTVSVSGDFVGITLRDSGLNQFIRLRQTSNQLQLCQQTPSGGFVILATAAFAVIASTIYHLKFRAIGSTLYGKAWQDGTTEPGAWAVTATTTVTSAGQVGLSASLGQSADIAAFDTFSVTEAQHSIVAGTTVQQDLAMRAGLVTKSGTQQRDLGMRARIVDLSTNAITVTTYAAKRKPLERRFPKS